MVNIWSWEKVPFRIAKNILNPSQQGSEIVTLAASALAKVQSQSFLKENFEILQFLLSFRSCFHGLQTLEPEFSLFSLP